MTKPLLLLLSIFCLSTVTSFGQSALSFGATNATTYVTFGNKSALGLSQFTIECWFKRTGTGTTTTSGSGGITTAIPLVTKGTSEGDGSTIDGNYFLGINTSGNKLCADFEEGAGGSTPGLNHPINGVTAISNNVWYHAAATYNGSTWNLYLNGMLEATLAVNQPCQNLSIQHSSIGSSIRSNGTTAQGFFAGVMDEVRIWNSARTNAQIQATANSQLSSPQTGMVARWGLNEGSGTAISDASGNNLSGNIVGTDFTWTTSVAPFNLVFTESLIRGPYLQKLTSSSITIRWNTNQAVQSRVKYGTDSLSLTGTVSDVANVTSHSLTITGLTPATKYYYSIGSPTLTLQGNGQNFFITSPVPGTAGKYNFWLVGDCGNNSTNQAQVRDKYIKYMGNTPTNAWLLLGDNAYSNGADSEYQSKFFNIYQGSIMKNAPLYPTPGNHDYSNGNATRQDDHNVPYYTIFDMPSSGEAGGVASNKKEYYSYDYGNVHFLSLDSYGEETNLRLYDTTGTQALWVKQDLAANTKLFTVAYWHHPPYTMGSHNSDTETELVKMHTNFIRILERYGVDLIVCGHSHVYERSKLMKGHYGSETSFDANIHDISQSTGRYDGGSNSCTYVKDTVHGFEGTIYLVSGSAGQLDVNGQATWPHNAMNGYSNLTNGGSSLLTVEGNRLDLKWICADSVIRDQFTLIKNANKVRNYTINYGQNLLLTASWPGQYSWSTGATTSSVTVSPTTNTTYIVRDQYQCVVDSFKVAVNAPTITVTSTIPSVCSGASMKIAYTVTGNFTAGNTFTAQLSNGLGSFSNPIPIGSKSSTVADSIPVVIPDTVSAGNNYLIRIVSTLPVVTSTVSNIFSVSKSPATPGTISIDGISASVCPGSTRVFTIAPVANASSYEWTVPANSSISSGQGSASVTVAFTSTFTGGDVCVRAISTCGISGFNCLTLTKSAAAPATPGLINNTSTTQTAVCGTMTYSVANLGYNYQWIYPAGSTNVTGQGTSSLTLTLPKTFNDTLKVTASNGCSTSLPRTLIIKSAINTPGTITISGGVNTGAKVCPSGDFKTCSIAAVTGATLYSWSVPSTVTGVSINGGGTSGTGQSISIAFNSNFTATSVVLSVVASNACNSSLAKTTTFTNGRPAQPSAITGSTTACPSDIKTYSITNAGLPYTWTISGDAILTPSGNTATVQFGSVYPVTLSVTCNTSCGTSLARTLTISQLTTVPGTPSVIAGTAYGVCANSTYNYSVTNVANLVYKWSFNSGVDTIPIAGTTNQITFTFPANFTATTGTLNVFATNGCGKISVVRKMTVYRAPATPVITGTTTPCLNTFPYSIKKVNGATSYDWPVITGASISHVNTQGTANDTSVNITFTTSGAKSVKAIAYSSCYSATRTITVTVGSGTLCREASADIADALETEMVVYPNPATSQVSVRFNGRAGVVYELSLIDITGRAVAMHTITAKNGANTFDFDLRDFARGIYVINLKSDHNTELKRVIIE